jgi:hypothetical protein
MIKNNPTNVDAAFEILLEEIEAEIGFVNGVGAKGFEARDYECICQLDLAPFDTFIWPHLAFVLPALAGAF